jgi:hypothetical protein
VLDGGDPVAAEIAVEPEGRPVEGAAFAKGTPLRVAETLRRGEVVDTEVLEFGPDGSRMEMVVILKLPEGQEAVDPEQMRRGLEQWTRAQQEIRKIAREDS